MMKECTVCKVSKNTEKDFYPYKNGRHKSECKKCSNRNYLRYQYGMPPGEFEKIFEAQKHSCALCKIKNTKRFSVDHSHATGKIRGILCQGCNILVGHIENTLIPDIKDLYSYIGKSLSD